MAVLETIRNFFTASVVAPDEEIVSAPKCEYAIHPLTTEHLKDVLRLNIRCFRNGDSYTKHTFDYLLTENRTLSYCIRTEKNEIVAFAFVMVNENGAAHLTTIGVAPEHRRRGLAVLLLKHIESALLKRGVSTLMLEVRIGNEGARILYRNNGFHVVQRIIKYYNNGEDCFLMIKALD